MVTGTHTGILKAYLQKDFMVIHLQINFTIKLLNKKIKRMEITILKHLSPIFPRKRKIKFQRNNGILTLRILTLMFRRRSLKEEKDMIKIGN